MFARFHSSIRRQRRRLVLLALILLLAGTVVAAHSTLSEDHMGETAAMCLAVVGAGAAALALVAPKSGEPLLRWLSPATPPPAPEPAVFVLPRARAGPPLLQVFRL